MVCYVIALDLGGVILHLGFADGIDYFSPSAALRQIRKAPAPIAVGIGADGFFIELLPVGVQHDGDALRAGCLMPRVAVPCLCARDRQALRAMGVHDVEAGGSIAGEAGGIAGNLDLGHGIHKSLAVLIGAPLSEYPAPVIFGAEREGAAGLLTAAEELHGYRLRAQPVLIVSVAPLLGDVHIDKAVIKAVV